MNCEKYEELISPYIDEELSDTEKADLERHLEQCSQCRGQVEALTYMRNMIKAEDVPVKPSSHIKRKVYYKIYRDLLIMFTGLVIIVSMVTISGGLAQMLLFDKISIGVRVLFYSGIALVTTGLIVLLYDITLNLFKVVFRK